MAGAGSVLFGAALPLPACHVVFPAGKVSTPNAEVSPAAGLPRPSSSSGGMGTSTSSSDDTVSQPCWGFTGGAFLLSACGDGSCSLGTARPDRAASARPPLSLLLFGLVSTGFVGCLAGDAVAGVEEGAGAPDGFRGVDAFAGAEAPTDGRFSGLLPMPTFALVAVVSTTG